MLAEIKIDKRIQGEIIDFSMIECGGCGIPYYVPTQWKTRKVKEHAAFSCPNGCSRQFIAKTAEDKLKEELSALQREKEEVMDQLLDTITEKKKVERQLKRVHKGVCPCCKRSFADLKKHMETKHPNETGS